MSDIVEIARLIRPYLDNLVDESEVARWNQRISELLAVDSAGEQVDDRLRALFLAHPVVQNWVADTLGDPDLRPPEVVAGLSTRGEPPAGDRVGSRLQQYVCPVNQCTKWYRVSSSEVVPRCTDHGEVLIEVRR
ncbi:hypothetical protein [Plantactinospora sp. KLBMP9567]|uniref:hypothetical protein n=1 Tax=Plantactinospora sp. KLBMP9567 TaxID=3085900 RepID=UPI002982A2F1|nr:hypothetical protein [Plantactinospora sp. KLBMP9567]MDW5329578.1 hypothetical protein [Plantactinospora sp. KLBMP9567]